MTLGIPLEIIWLHVCDASLIYVPLRDKSLVHEFPQPFAGCGVVLVVVHAGPHMRCPAAADFVVLHALFVLHAFVVLHAFFVPHGFFCPAFEGAAVSTSLPPPS